MSRVVSVIRCRPHHQSLAARNQIEGAVVMGIGMALFEGTEYDALSGAPVNASLADYVVATNADVPALDVHFVEYPDFNLNTLGARGVGEIGLGRNGGGAHQRDLSRNRRAHPRTAAED